MLGGLLLRIDCVSRDRRCKVWFECGLDTNYVDAMER
jgi:hypothetical protein